MWANFISQFRKEIISLEKLSELWYNIEKGDATMKRLLLICTRKTVLRSVCALSVRSAFDGENHLTHKPEFRSDISKKCGVA